MHAVQQRQSLCLLGENKLSQEDSIVATAMSQLLCNRVKNVRLCVCVCVCVTLQICKPTHH